MQNGKISNFKQIATLRRYAISDGREKGLDVIDCDNGKIRFLLNVTKALDIMQLYHEGQNMSYLSKNAFLPTENGFLKRFEGGMLYTCGLDAVGGREGHTEHGAHHNEPAEVIVARCDDDGIEVVARIYDTEVFGENFVMTRRVYTAIGSTSLTVEDTLENKAFTPKEYALLYHINVGYPMLDEGAKILADTDSVTPRTPYSALFTDDAFSMEKDTAGREEMCYYLGLPKGEIVLENEKIKKTFKVIYSKETLSEFLEWKSMTSGDYALGLEPATTKLDDGLTFKTLDAGEKVNFKIEMRIENI